MRHERVYAAFEITVAGQDAAAATMLPSFTAASISGLQRPGIADAGRAAVADRVEAECVEIVVEFWLFQVVGDNFRPRREARLDPGFGA